MNDRREVLRFFQDQKSWFEDKVEAGIEANRKGFGRIKVVDAEGNPVAGAQVKLRQKTHDFRFGANVFMLDSFENEEKNETYKKAYAELFNLAVLPFYWKDNEPEQGKLRFDKDSPFIYRRPPIDTVLEYCVQNGIEPKLHCLNYDNETPLWVPDDVAQIKQLLDRRIQQIAERYKDRIPSMEVTNEFLMDKCGVLEDNHSKGTPFFDEPDVIEWSFEHARKYLPNNKLIINEAAARIFKNSQFHFNRSAYYMMIDRALSKGAPIDSIGMQYHVFYPPEQERKVCEEYYNPKHLYTVLDQYLDFRKPMQITEMTIPAYSGLPEDEDIQAEIVTNLFRIFFSHPNMEAICYWNLVDGYAAEAPMGDMTAGENKFHGGLINFDMSPKPVYLALKKLIHETWNTRLDLTTPQPGQLDFKGFYGQYDVEVTANGKTTISQIHLQKAASNTFEIQV